MQYFLHGDLTYMIHMFDLKVPHVFMMFSR